MISLEDWALIRRLVADGVPQRQVAKELGIARATVARALASAGPPKYTRPKVDGAFSAVEPAGRALLAEHPDLPGTVLAERVGWIGSITWFREQLAPVRATYRPDPVDRLVHAPGDVAQCDLWFPAVQIPTGVVAGGQQRITDPAHVTTAAALRAALLTPPAKDSAHSARESSSMLRDLLEYDRAFGISAEDLTPAALDGLDGKVAWWPAPTRPRHSLLATCHRRRR